MRNFFFALKAQSVFSVRANTRFEKLLGELWIRFGNSLPYDPKSLTPSEQEVVDHLQAWFNINKLNEQSNSFVTVTHPVFVYHNLNDGRSCLFFWNKDYAEYSSEVSSHEILS